MPRGRGLRPMKNSLEYLELVRMELAIRMPEYTITVEYPGFLLLRNDEVHREHEWAFGAANSTWQGNLTSVDEPGETITVVDTGLPTYCQIRPDCVASFIRAAVDDFYANLPPTETDLDDMRL